MEYSVNIGITYFVLADNEEAAMDLALEMASDTYGKEFAHDSWQAIGDLLP